MATEPISALRPVPLQAMQITQPNPVMPVQLKTATLEQRLYNSSAGSIATTAHIPKEDISYEDYYSFSNRLYTAEKQLANFGTGKKVNGYL